MNQVLKEFEERVDAVRAKYSNPGPGDELEVALIVVSCKNERGLLIAGDVSMVRVIGELSLATMDVRAAAEKQPLVRDGNKGA